MAKQKLWAIAAAAGISAVLLTGCDDPGGGIDDDLEDDSRGSEEPSDVATEPSE